MCEVFDFEVKAARTTLVAGQHGSDAQLLPSEVWP